MNRQVDCLVLGGGAAGLFCGARTAARGRRTLVLDHARRPAEKVRISGGGRCNFTNLQTSAGAFLSDNPHFAKSALARYTPWDFCDLMAKHDLTWHEKTLGQLFCDQKSGAVIDLLLSELLQAGGQLQLESTIDRITHSAGRYQVTTATGTIETTSLIVATGGLSIPKMAVSGLAYDIARQFGHAIITPRPGLVPLTFTGQAHTDFAALAGIAVPVEICAARGPAFAESLLFTHRGLSGPAILQISSYWRETEPIRIDLLPGIDAVGLLNGLKRTHPRQMPVSALSDSLPIRLLSLLGSRPNWPQNTRMAELSNRQIEQLAHVLKTWTLTPAGTEGWRTAEVTLGGIDTRDLSSRTMQSKISPGLYFIGECLDVTGWLGGYNFQWAWASASAAGEVA